MSKKIAAILNDRLRTACPDERKLDAAARSAAALYDNTTADLSVSVKAMSTTLTAAFVDTDPHAVELVELAKEWDAVMYDAATDAVYFQPAHPHARVFFIAIVSMNIYKHINYG